LAADQGGRPQGVKWTLRLVSLAVACALLVACGGSPPAGSPALGVWGQTWPIAYGDTTCVHWADEMDAHQRRVMAGDTPLRVQRSDKPDAGMPPLQQIYTLTSATDQMCENEGRQVGMKVTEIAAMLYALSDDLKP
jgi:hypothetical protein